MNPSRSQAMLRVPVNIVDAILYLHDGQPSEVMLFVPPSDDLAQFISEGNPFLPVVRAGEELFVARAAIACVGLPPQWAPRFDEDLPVEQQQARVTLRSGAVIEGVMRWVALDGRRRTSDGLNTDAPYLVVHADPTTYLVMKTHIASVSEV